MSCTLIYAYFHGLVEYVNSKVKIVKLKQKTKIETVDNRHAHIK